MKNWHKIIIILLAVLILVSSLLVLLLRSRLVSEAIEDMVISRLEEIIRYPLSYNELKIGFWGTIAVKDISVGDPALHKSAPLLTCPNMVLQCRILPLLFKKIVIEKVSLHQPRIHLERAAQWDVNLAGDTSPEAKKGIPKGDSAVTGSDLPAFSFIIDRLTIVDGMLAFGDYSENSTRPLEPILQQLNLTVSGFSMGSPFPLSLSAQVAVTPPSRVTLKALVDPLSSRVTANLEIQTDGRPECKVQVDGTIALNNNLLTIEQLRAISGDSTVSVKGTLQNCFSGPLAGKFQVTSPALVVDTMIPCLAAMGDEEEMDQGDEGEERVEEGSEAGPFNFDGAKIDADFVLDSISYGNIRVSDVKASCGLHDNAVNLESLQGALGDGLVQMKGRVDLGVGGVDYSVHLTGHNLQLKTIVAAVSPNLKGNFQGLTDFTVNLSGCGTTQESFEKHLKGEGDIQIKDGSVSDLEFLQSLASFIKVDKLDTLTFDHSHGTFRVADGLIHTTNNLRGKEIELYPEGTISLDAYVNLALKMRISPSLSEQIVDGVLTKYFTDEMGWTVIDLAIKGPSEEVVVMPASSTIKSISEMLVDILLTKEEGNEKQGKRESLEGLLEKLIKRPPEEETPVKEENTSEVN